MYGKLFAQMYDGSLTARGSWQALVTFQQLIILADEQGVVDMTLDAIARRTTIPLDILEAGMPVLMAPDPDSRTPHEDGRRVLPLQDGRSWGWAIVNYEHYRKIRSAEERREYLKQYQRDRRAGVPKGARAKEKPSTDLSTPVLTVNVVNQSSKQYVEAISKGGAVLRLPLAVAALERLKGAAAKGWEAPLAELVASAGEERVASALVDMDRKNVRLTPRALMAFVASANPAPRPRPPAAVAPAPPPTPWCEECGDGRLVEAEGRRRPVRMHDLSCSYYTEQTPVEVS